MENTTTKTSLGGCPRGGMFLRSSKKYEDISTKCNCPQGQVSTRVQAELAGS